MNTTKKITKPSNNNIEETIQEKLFNLYSKQLEENRKLLAKLESETTMIAYMLELIKDKS